MHFNIALVLLYVAVFVSFMMHLSEWVSYFHPFISLALWFTVYKMRSVERHNYYWMRCRRHYTQHTTPHGRNSAKVSFSSLQLLSSFFFVEVSTAFFQRGLFLTSERRFLKTVEYLMRRLSLLLPCGFEVSRHEVRKAEWGEMRTTRRLGRRKLSLNFRFS